MIKDKKQELAIFLVVIGIAAFFRLYMMVPIATMGTIIPPLIGILTVVGLYLLAKEMFEWRLAAISSFLLTISFWHVNFSRSNFQEIWIPFFLVSAFYFMWRALKNNHLPDFLMAGILGGLGFYADSSFYAAPLIAIAVFINYWWYLKNDFGHAKYEHAKNQLLRGFALLALTTIIVALPMGLYLWQHPGNLVKQNAELRQLPSNIVKTLGMLNFTGDLNPEHNIPGDPMLPWPIGVFFAVGFINELIHWFKRKHGHFSTIHTLLFVWFFVMLIPGFLSATAPNALLTIGVLPAVMIFSARGIWWFFEKISVWYKTNDPTEFLGGLKHRQETTPSHSIHEAHVVTALVMMIFLFSIGFMEYWRYFQR